MKSHIWIIVTLIVALTKSTPAGQKRKTYIPSRAPLSGNEGIHFNDWNFIDESSLVRGMPSRSNPVDGQLQSMSHYQERPSYKWDRKGKALMHDPDGLITPRRASQRLAEASMRAPESRNQGNEHENHTKSDSTEDGDSSFNGDDSLTSSVPSDRVVQSANRSGNEHLYFEEAESSLQDPQDSEQGAEKKTSRLGEKTRQREQRAKFLERWNEMRLNTKDYSPRSLATLVRSMNLDDVSQISTSKMATSYIKNIGTAPRYHTAFKKALYKESVRVGVAKYRENIRPASQRRRYVRTKPVE